MDSIVKALLHSIQEADPNYGAHTLEPVKPREQILGTLSDESRRIFTVMILQYERQGVHIQKGAELEANFQSQDIETIDEWSMVSRILRTRYEALRMLFRLSLYNDVRRMSLYDTCLIREGFTIVAINQHQKENAGIERATSVILNNTFEGLKS